MMLTETINNLLDPIRLKRQEIEETPEIITQALEE
jgi:hypothetical protein